VRLAADRRQAAARTPSRTSRSANPPPGRARGHHLKISEDQLFYCQQRGISAEDAVNMIVNGFCKEVFKELPMEFAVEAQKLLGVSLEGSGRLSKPTCEHSRSNHHAEIKNLRVPSPASRSSRA
jgi:hypothetical protein